MDIVKTDAGYISGTVIGEPDKPVHVYRGIPYAAPPVGDLRWKPPQPVVPWKGIRECTSYGAVAPQYTAGISLVGDAPMSEDCLYLNVTTPAKTASDRLPVMVWLHGGALIIGSGTIWSALRLVSNGVVLVGVNMRLGPLGLLAHPILSRESPHGVSGNYLFLDMVAALRWVRGNISVFGGDPDNVTIFGESGGSTKVVNLMASPLAKGLFHRAIGESECGLGTPLREMEARGKRLFAKVGIHEEKDLLAAARALPWQKVIEAGEAVSTDMNLSSGPPWSPWDSAVDGWFLPDTPANVFKEGKQNAVPFIMGANLGELTGPGMLLMPWVIPGYVNLVAGANRVGGKAYGYIFDHVPAGWKKDGTVAVHSIELPYVFGDLDWRSPLWGIVFFLAQASGARSPDPTLNNIDRKLSDLMIKMWTNFAKTGDPSIEGVVDWPAWDEATDRYLYITESPEARSGFSKVGQK
jgi:para-nitrobenzyl esterase